MVFLDLETTGLSTASDRIVEITILKVHPDGHEESVTRLINPEIPIPLDATSVHGITNEKVSSEPKFKQIAKSFLNFLEDCDLCGFNIKKYDLPLLEAEFKRAGIEFSRVGRRIIDTQIIFHRSNPRNLEAAYQIYCNKQLVNSHSSHADARACAEILDAQLRVHDDLPKDIDGLHEYCCDPEEVNWLDSEGKFLSIEGEVVCNFGKKHKGRSLKEIAKNDFGYIEWMMNADFSEEVKEILAKFTRAFPPH